ncbi:pyrimidine/purine nucleoside phosphorylase [Mucilaginibacter gynuensis]|uniref:Pyrimidine/purine nucleoside phosphorylase n=1 Tax=Mucilaginibacter gynuensis TaxID=1302236 RepID=A0ABP8FRI9_9SPHI
MIDVNQYFDGAVKSLGYTSAEGKTTVGVMEPGEYEFGTSQHETMTVLEGELHILLPHGEAFQSYTNGQTFEVEANVTFKVKASLQTSYLCKYR